MLARRTESAWEVLAPAKLNLYLDVLGRRDDGFHELDTVMAPLRLYDRLRWTAGRDGAQPERFDFQYSAATEEGIRRAAPADATNLVWRACDLLARTAGLEPYGRLRLAKRIPLQAGLGGGSSDAAAALSLVNAAWGVHYSPRRLAALGAELGSDVPFFFAGGAAICRGRGEQIAPLGRLPRLDVVVVKPPSGVSTPAAFAELRSGASNDAAARASHRRVAALVDALREGAVARAGQLMTNRLEAAVARICPWIAQVRTALARVDCPAAVMTGSGSAFFCVMRSARHARQIAAALGARLFSRQPAANADSPGRRPSERLGCAFAAATCHTAISQMQGA